MTYGKGIQSLSNPQEKYSRSGVMFKAQGDKLRMEIHILYCPTYTKIEEKSNMQ